jgi:hypothetical protein
VRLRIVSSRVASARPHWETTNIDAVLSSLPFTAENSAHTQALNEKCFTLLLLLITDCTKLLRRSSRLSIPRDSFAFPAREAE